MNCKQTLRCSGGALEGAHRRCVCTAKKASGRQIMPIPHQPPSSPGAHVPACTLPWGTVEGLPRQPRPSRSFARCFGNLRGSPPHLSPSPAQLSPNLVHDSPGGLMENADSQALPPKDQDSAGRVGPLIRLSGCFGNCWVRLGPPPKLCSPALSSSPPALTSLPSGRRVSSTLCLEND